MVKAYQYRVYPTKKQLQTFESQFEACQILYNQAPAWRKVTYQQKDENVSHRVQQARLTPLRNASLFWDKLHIDILQDTLRKLDKSYKAFFCRVKLEEKPGFPRFKGKERYRSMTYSYLSVNLIRDIGRRLARIVVLKVGQVKIRVTSERRKTSSNARNNNSPNAILAASGVQKCKPVWPNSTSMLSINVETSTLRRLIGSTPNTMPSSSKTCKSET